MACDDYKVMLYRNEPKGWVAEIPIKDCYALMPTKEGALSELTQVSELIAAEYRERGLLMSADTTAIVNALWQGRGLSFKSRSA